MKYIKKQDVLIHQAIKNEQKRQQDGIELIPSENITSRAVMEALGSVLTNKYSEGYPGKRYYGGQQFIDEIEDIARERAKKLFGVPYVNVQPYSGSPANLAVYVATCSPGDTVMGQNLLDGGHLTHGWKASATSMFYHTVPYHVRSDGYLNIQEIEELALKNKPKLIWVGATAYVREFPFKELSKIADSVGAYLVADISHVTGLIISGVHSNPVPYVHLITTTTHKTLRGPRGGMILVTQKGIDKDPQLAKKIDQAIFPRLQGGPHDHQTAAIAVALGEAMKPEFRRYGKQIVVNAKALADALIRGGMDLVSGGTDNHMILMKCGNGRGIFFQDALDAAGITVNKNTIPNDTSSPFYPSGIRLGTPSVTTRGMKVKEMKKIAQWIVTVSKEVGTYTLPSKDNISQYMKVFYQDIKSNPKIRKIKQEVKLLCKEYPLYKD